MLKILKRGVRNITIVTHLAQIHLHLVYNVHFYCFLLSLICTSTDEFFYGTVFLKVINLIVFSGIVELVKKLGNSSFEREDEEVIIDFFFF